MSVFQEKVLGPAEDALCGRIVSVPIHLNRVDDMISIRKKVYSLFSGGTGSGKTSFVDDTYVLNPYMWWYESRDMHDIKFRVLYRSMERQLGSKLAKWACWKLYRDTGKILDSDTLMGYRKTKIDQDTWKMIVNCRDWADEMLDYVDVIDGRTSPKDLDRWIDTYAAKHGVILSSDELNIYQHLGHNNKVQVATFDPKCVRTLKNGEQEIYMPLTIGEKAYTIRQDSRLYIENDPKLFTTIILDHIGKINESGYASKKAAIDAASNSMSDARDKYNFSPVVVSQLNRAISDPNRMKMSGGDIAPIIEDIKDSGNTVEDSDLVLSLFNPYRYRVYDEGGMYKGYNIAHQFLAPGGENRFRLLSVLKNSYGKDDVEYGLRFWGEFGGFATLPRPDNHLDISTVVGEIQLGK